MKYRIVLFGLLIAFNVSMLNGQSIMKDASGKIEVALFSGTSNRTSAPSLTISPGGDWVVVNGGGWTDWMEHGGKGSLLYASYPSRDLKSWTIKAKDHLLPDPCVIQGYAIGMRIKGLTRDQLMAHMHVGEISSGKDPVALATVACPSGYIMLGGGFEVSWFGKGNMIMGSAPFAPGWRVVSKDHLESDPGVVKGFLIGIREKIPNVGTFVSEVKTNEFRQRAFPQGMVALSSGFVLVGGGAIVMNNFQNQDSRNALEKFFQLNKRSNTGKLLWKNTPSSQNAWEAGAKDHKEPDATAWLKVIAIGLKLRAAPAGASELKKTIPKIR